MRDDFSKDVSTKPLHVTVVIPCHNRADTVEAAVRSVLEQDYPAFDVIAVDDGSDDNTLDVLRAIDDPRLQVMPNTGLKGVCGARNAGASRARGDWVAFQDSDDLWKPHKLASQMRKVACGDWVAVYCAMDIVEGEGAAKRSVGRVPATTAIYREGDIRPGLALTSLVSTQTVIIRRDVFEAEAGFDTAFKALVDWELMLRVAEHGAVAFVDEELVEQRLSDNSITRSGVKRLSAQEQILAKHHHLLARSSRALAKHHYRIAGAYRQMGQFQKALPHLQKAFQAAPYVPKHLAQLVWVFAQQAFGSRRLDRS